jgi:hypothetical protein
MCAKSAGLIDGDILVLLGLSGVPSLRDICGTSRDLYSETARYEYLAIECLVRSALTGNRELDNPRAVVREIWSIIQRP